MELKRSKIHREELESDDYDSFYAQLEREISILTADSEDGDNLYANNKSMSSSQWMTKGSSNVSYLAGKQQERYFCWMENDKSENNSVPTWLLNLWRNDNNVNVNVNGNGNGNGTGVFIPHIVNSRRRNKPRKKNNDKGKPYKPVVIKKGC